MRDLGFIPMLISCACVPEAGLSLLLLSLWLIREGCKALNHLSTLINKSSCDFCTSHFIEDFPTSSLAIALESLEGENPFCFLFSCCVISLRSAHLGLNCQLNFCC